VEDKKITFTFKGHPTLKSRAEKVLGKRRFSSWIANLAESDLKKQAKAKRVL